jgi:hypothetical protein
VCDDTSTLTAETVGYTNGTSALIILNLASARAPVGRRSIGFGLARGHGLR